MDKKTENKSKLKKQNFMTRNLTVFIGAMICSMLWGSAYPSVKAGMELFGVRTTDIGSEILFAGIRFTLAGLLVVLMGSLLERKMLIPNKTTHPRKILILALFQTIGQYIPYYIGLGHTTGTNTAIVDSLSYFLSILSAALIFKLEKLNVKIILGCVLGFLGVVLINITGSGFFLQMSFMGEGMVLLSAISYSFSSVFAKVFSKDDDPVLLSGYQFFFGGLVIILIGVLSGGKLTATSPKAYLLLLYLAFVSTGAYTLWTILLKYNEVSKVSVYGFMTPVFGVLFSVLILGETDGIRVQYIIAMVLISIGIALVNGKQKTNRQ